MLISPRLRDISTNAICAVTVLRVSMGVSRLRVDCTPDARVLTDTRTTSVFFSGETLCATDVHIAAHEHPNLLAGLKSMYGLVPIVP